MEDPFFMHSWTPSRRSYFPHSRPQPKPSPPSKPKVVSIPVHFVASDNGDVRKPVARPTEADMSASAVKIQKAARGFLVRKNLRTVRKIAAEAEELARRIEAEEEAIRRDARERLRIGEMLMALLLRLDSVRGVRDCRKKVIRRVIQLQEAVDSIVATAETTQDQAPIDPEPMELPRSKMDDPDQTEGKEEEEESSAGDPMKGNPDTAPSESCNTMDEVQETEANDEEAISTEGVHGRSTECKDVMRESAVEAVRGGDGSADEDLMQETMEIQMSTEDPIESMADSMEGAPESQVTRSEEESTVEIAIKGEEGDQLQGMLITGGAAESPGRKQMMENENEQLKDMVAELCRRSEQQCLLMTGLLQRVEHLERAVQRMERKKKRHAPSSLDKKCNQKKQ